MIALKEKDETKVLTDEDLDMFWYESWDDPKIKKSDREETQLMDEWEDILSPELEKKVDKLLKKRKIRLTGKYKERRYIP
jgi:hypothetical protein